MLNVVKRTILAGIGATVTTKEKVEVALKELVDKGSITAKEARVIGEKIVRGSKKEFDKNRKKLENQIQDTISRAKERINQVSELEKRVSILEAKLGIKKTARMVTKKVAKKAATKKKKTVKKKTAAKK